MATDWLGLLATVGGGLLGSQANKDQTQTVSKDPWGPAQPYLLDNLQTNQQMQKFYQANPFNAQQKVGLQNTMGDSDNFRANIMPGLMDFANKGMTSSYQRQTGGAVGSGGGYGGAVVPGGMRQSGTGPFSAPTGGLFGTVDWQANNPFGAQNQPTPQAGQAAMQSGGLLGGQGGLLGGQGGEGFSGQEGTPDKGNVYGIGSSFNTDMATSVFAKASALGIPAAAISSLLAGFASGHMSKEEIAADVASLDAALAAKDARNHGGGYSSPDGGGAGDYGGGGRSGDGGGY